jgi:hypothetical protein
LERPFPIATLNRHIVTQKARPLAKAGLSLEMYQPRMRERIMKLSKLYSAICHRKYWIGAIGLHRIDRFLEGMVLRGRPAS